MSANANPAEKRAIVQAFPTADINGSSPTEDYVSFKNFEHVCVVINAGDVQGDITVTLLQATAVAGTGEKALGFDFVWRSTALGVKTKVTVTSDTFDITAASDDNTIWEIPIDASELDVANDFDVMRVNLTDPAAVALVGAQYEMWNGRYTGATIPSAITD